MLGYIDGEMFEDGTHTAIYGPALMKEVVNDAPAIIEEEEGGEQG